MTESPADLPATVHVGQTDLSIFLIVLGIITKLINLP
jgi:hypothetical protein